MIGSPATQKQESHTMYDTIIKNGTVIDGTGNKRFKADIGILDGIIRIIGDLTQYSALETIDASGLFVAPGFIDIHTHSDMALPLDSRSESQIRQGVTTEVVGNCGTSLAPTTDEGRARLLGMVGIKDTVAWTSYASYLDALEATGVSTNIAGLAGHGAIRDCVMGGNAPRVATQDEVSRMADILDRALGEGAFGFSTGLEYHPGKEARYDEILELCKITAKHNGLYATHTRNRDTCYISGFGEALDVARNSGVRLQISHINPKYGRPKHTLANTFKMMEWAEQEGVDVGFDWMPFNWNFTSLMALLPSWANRLTQPELAERLSTPEGRAQLKVNPMPIWQLVVEEKWDKVRLLNSQTNAALIGKTIEEIAGERRVRCWDAVFDLLLQETTGPCSVFASTDAFSEEDNLLALSHADCIVMSDTMGLANEGPLAQKVLGFSGYNWVPRYITRYLLEKHLLPLEEGIRRITSLPAKRIGLADRGRIAPGMAADITVFDLEGMKDNSDFFNPRRYATGFPYVLVNGIINVRDGKRVSHGDGKVLKKA